MPGYTVGVGKIDRFTVICVVLPSAFTFSNTSGVAQMMLPSSSTPSPGSIPLRSGSSKLIAATLMLAIVLLISVAKLPSLARTAWSRL